MFIMEEVCHLKNWRQPSRGEKKFLREILSSWINRLWLLLRTANLQKLFLENKKLEKDVDRFKRKLLQEKISYIDPNIQFSRKELEEQLFKIEKDVVKLKNNLTKSKTRQEVSNSRLANARNRLADRTLAPDKLARAEKDVENWRIWGEAYDLEVEIIGQGIQYLEEIKKLWQDRFALFNKTESIDLSRSAKGVEEALAQLEREKRLLSARQADCLNERIGQALPARGGGDYVRCMDIIQSVLLESEKPDSLLEAAGADHFLHPTSEGDIA